MDSTPPNNESSSPATERVIYVTPQAAASDEINLVDLWNILWAGRWLGIGITALLAVTTAAVSLVMTEWYRAEVLLAPAEERSTQSGAGLGGLGGLAGLAGIRVGASGNVEPIAVLRSREFIRAFIEDLDLVPILLPRQLDGQDNGWGRTEGEGLPDIRDAVKYFRENILTVVEDRDSQLVTLSVEWTDPEVAADWANILVKRLNDRMRLEALREAEANVAYLQNELAGTTLVTLQQSIGRLLETELQKLMLARGNEQFSFKVIDPAEPPLDRSRPARTLMVILATALGGVLSALVLFVRHALRTQSSRNPL